MSAHAEIGESHSVIADRLAKALVRHGVEVIFGQSLPSALMLAAEDAGIRQFVYRTENAGGAMADAYARVSGKIGVVAAQNGPAAALLVAPLAEALKASIPVLALVQEVDRHQVDRNAFQELDHLKLFDACAKWVRRLTDPTRADDYIDMAMTAACAGRPGPAVLLLPVDLLSEPAPPRPFRRTAALGTWPLDRAVPEPARIDEAAHLLAEARNPLVIAGGGVHSASASAALATLQEQAGLPVAYTMMGKGAVDDRHPLTVGLIGNVMGAHSLGRFTRPIVERADVVLLLGTRTNQNGTDSWSLYPQNAEFIHVDVDSQELGRTYQPAVRLAGDAQLTILALLERLRASPRANRRNSLELDVAEAKRNYERTVSPLNSSSAKPIRPERVMNELQAQLTPETVVVADASYASVWITSCLCALTAGQRFITPRGLAGLGWGFPMALGAKVALPNAPVVCIVGDGGFGHCWSELETALRTRTGVVLVVLNNSVLGYQKDAETAKFGRYTSACHFDPVDHRRLAEACGVAAHRIQDPGELGVRLRDALDRAETVLLDVVTDPKAFPPLTMFDDAGFGPDDPGPRNGRS